MFQIVTWLVVPVVLIEFCLLRCGVRNVPLSILISAFLNSLLWLGLYIACNWDIEVIPESPQTPGAHLAGRMIFYAVLVVLVTAVSLVPAGLCALACSRWKRAKPESAA
jgi:hypothetical protein